MEKRQTGVPGCRLQIVNRRSPIAGYAVMMSGENILTASVLTDKPSPCSIPFAQVKQLRDQYPRNYLGAGGDVEPSARSVDV